MQSLQWILGGDAGQLVGPYLLVLALVVGGAVHGIRRSLDLWIGRARRKSLRWLQLALAAAGPLLGALGALVFHPPTLAEAPASLRLVWGLAAGLAAKWVWDERDKIRDALLRGLDRWVPGRTGRHRRRDPERVSESEGEDDPGPESRRAAP